MQWLEVVCKIVMFSHFAKLPKNNRLFYSCVLRYLAMNASESGRDLVLIQTSLLFLFKCQLVSIRTT